MATSMELPPVEYHYGERTYTSLQSIVSDPTHLLMSSSVSGSTQAPLGGDLNILSASRYPQALMEPYRGTEHTSRKRKVVDTKDQYYGGIVLRGASASDANNSSSGETDPSLPSKKKRSGRQPAGGDQDDQSDPKKQRGRPRLD